MVFGFTDGSARPGTPDIAASAYRLYTGRSLTASKAFAYTEATAYDAEIMALAACISRGIETSTTDLHIFADSQSAVDSVFDVSPHSYILQLKDQIIAIGVSGKD